MYEFTKTFFTLALLLIATASPVGGAHAVELGLSPSPAYGLWSNINKATLAYARASSSDEQWIVKLEKMEPRKFSGKVPANVLEQVQRFKAKLDELDADGAAHTVKTLLEGNLSDLLTSADNRITPSVVYLHSGQVLTNIAEHIVHLSPTETHISPFFEDQHFVGKTPSDVFGLVDLGLQRLDEILIRQKAGQLTIKEGAK